MTGILLLQSKFIWLTEIHWPLETDHECPRSETWVRGLVQYINFCILVSNWKTDSNLTVATTGSKRNPKMQLTQCGQWVQIRSQKDWSTLFKIGRRRWKNLDTTYRAARRKGAKIGSRRWQKGRIYLQRNDLAKRGEKLKEKNSKKKGIEEAFFKMLLNQDFYGSKLLLTV